MVVLVQMLFCNKDSTTIGACVQSSGTNFGGYMNSTSNISFFRAAHYSLSSKALERMGNGNQGWRAQSHFHSIKKDEFMVQLKPTYSLCQPQNFIFMRNILGYINISKMDGNMHAWKLYILVWSLFGESWKMDMA